jgi:uncharacterized lipoprotein YbaY
VKTKHVFSTFAVLLVLALTFAAVPFAQAQNNAQTAPCVETYSVVAGDTLSKIAEKFLGDLKAYQQIADATNNANKTDASFAKIADVNKIEVGWKLCIPAKSGAPATTPAANQTPAATAAPSVTPLTQAQLGNATYQVEGAPGGDVTLKDGKAEEELAPGSASKFTAQLGDKFANGTLGNNAPYSSDILITSGGGSGTFYYVAAVPNNNGQPGTGITTLLGDRIKVESLGMANGAIQVSYLTRKEGEPFTAEPTVPVNKTYVLENGKLVEGATIQPVAPTPAAQGPFAGSWISSSPAADAVALLRSMDLGPNSNASMTNLYVGKGESEETGTWTQTTPETVEVEFIQQDGKNIDDKFTFQLNAAGDTLTATQYDQGLYGESGVTMYKASGSVTGTVTYLSKIALPNGAVVEVYLLDVTKQDAPAEYVSGTTYTTNGQQVPLPYTVLYAPSQIKQGNHYAVQAFISADGKPLFRSTGSVPVITNGATSNVEIVVEPAP